MLLYGFISRILFVSNQIKMSLLTWKWLDPLFVFTLYKNRYVSIRKKIYEIYVVKCALLASINLVWNVLLHIERNWLIIVQIKIDLISWRYNTGCLKIVLMF